MSVRVEEIGGEADIRRLAHRPDDLHVLPRQRFYNLFDTAADAEDDRAAARRFLVREENEG